MMKFPFNRAFVAGDEFEYMGKVAQVGALTGNGEFTFRCQALLEKELGAAKAFLTPSCTQALEMAALLIGIGPGDEVIVPSYTFISTASAFVLRGAKPVFADVRPDTLNLDEAKLEALITPKTKAVVPVHYNGVGCEMEAISAFAKRFGIQVIEDNAHGLFSNHRGKPLGTFGALAAQSFDGNKNFTCGQGGCLLVNDASLVERAEMIREYGTNRALNFRKKLGHYSWVDIGSNFILSELSAAFLCGQLERRWKIQDARRKIWEGYFTGLREWAFENEVKLPFTPEGAEQSYHIFYLMMPSQKTALELSDHMKSKGIACLPHYWPLHLSEMGRSFGGKEGDCPVSEEISGKLLRLPLNNSLTDGQQAEVISALREFRLKK